MFSDCMYLITEPQYIDQLICLLSNFAYNLLVNRTTYVKSKIGEGTEIVVSIPNKRGNNL